MDKSTPTGAATNWGLLSHFAMALIWIREKIWKTVRSPMGPGPVYVDSIEWNGGLTATNTPNLLGTSLAADFNLDDQVDMADFAILASNFNLDGTTRLGGGDMTGDGRTDLRDWALFRQALLAAPGAACSRARAKHCLVLAPRQSLSGLLASSTPCDSDPLRFSSVLVFGINLDTRELQGLLRCVYHSDEINVGGIR